MSELLPRPVRLLLGATSFGAGDRRLRGAVGGKVVLVTGASSGVGKATAVRLGAAGATVLLVARRAETIMCRNHRGFLLAEAAVTRLGCDIVPMGNDFAGPQLADVLAREGASAAIYDEEFERLFDDAGFERTRIIGWHEHDMGRPTLDALIFGDVLYNGYASTEVGSGALATPGDLRAAPGTVGRPMAGIRIKILDEEGLELPQGETGRIFVGRGSPRDHVRR